ncbi:unnamed protein product [Onchocerca flexuosa]|uniref:RBD domain-containing protein n=1 Tax=Onchocerca flexuosa TaxID=387005 RepID=A0A183I7X9_9BILA|nr:unnamed protein product [Onchocerca flexuosa]
MSKIPKCRIGITEEVQSYPGQKLRDCLDRRLREHGLASSDFKFSLENSRKPLPDNYDTNLLSGRKIIAHGESESMNWNLKDCFN